MIRTTFLVLLLFMSVLLSGCPGYGSDCTSDEAGDSLSNAYDMGSMRPIYGLRWATLEADGSLQTVNDEDWYRFVVTDPIFVPWRPLISLAVFSAPGTTHTGADFEVTIFDQDGQYVTDLSGNSERLRGIPLSDDGVPYYVRVRWANPELMGKVGGSDSLSCANAGSKAVADSPSPTASPGDSTATESQGTPTPNDSEATASPGDTEGEATESYEESPTPSPSPTATEELDNGPDSCTRYLLKIRN